MESRKFDNMCDKTQPLLLWCYLDTIQLSHTHTLLTFMTFMDYMIYTGYSFLPEDEGTGLTFNKGISKRTFLNKNLRILINILLFLWNMPKLAEHGHFKQRSVSWHCVSSHPNFRPIAEIFKEQYLSGRGRMDRWTNGRMDRRTYGTITISIGANGGWG